MEMNLQADIRMGLGCSQSLGLVCRNWGNRVALLTEGLYTTSRERDILKTSLDRAGLKTLHLEYLEGDDPFEFARVNRSLLRSSRSEVAVVYGGNRLLHLVRWMIMEEALENQIHLVLVPAVPGFPYLFRREGFWGAGHPTDSQFYEWNSSLQPAVILDPYLTTSMGARQSVGHLLQTVLFLIEALLHEQMGLFLRSLCLGCLEGLWGALGKVFDQPSKGDFRVEGFEAGLAAAVAHHCLPRLSATAAVTILEGITLVPHGVVGAVLLPWLLESYAPRNPDILWCLVRAMGYHTQQESNDALGMELGRQVRKLLGNFGLPLRLRDLDLVEAEILHAADLVKDWKTPPGGAVKVEALAVFLRSAF